jgi:hypothetical protein
MAPRVVWLLFCAFGDFAVGSRDRSYRHALWADERALSVSGYLYVKHTDYAFDKTIQPRDSNNS